MRRALIVDDNEQNLYLLTKVLEGHGFEVTTSANGSQALEAARRNPPAIVISDILMPVMDGFALCAEWMQDEHLYRIPFVFYTATYTDHADEALGLGLGAARFIVKPVEMDEFVRSVQEVLREFESRELPVLPRSMAISDEPQQHRLYNAALVRRLEAKSVQLEAARNSLEEQVRVRARAEEELRLYARVFEQAHEGILITDAEEKIIAVNRAFCALTGYREFDLLAQPPFMLVTGPGERNLFQDIRTTLAAGRRWQGEVWIRNKTGESLPMWMSASSLRNPSGQLSANIGVFLDLSEQKAHTAQLEKVAFFDPATGLPNRALLMDRLEQILTAAARSDETVAVLFLNLDQFKEINQAHGHHVGDLVLQEVTHRFAQCLPEDELLARFGGDEFVVVQERSDQTGADFTAVQLADALTEPIAVGNLSLPVTVSIGIALCPLDGSTASDLIQKGGIAMHRAKAANRTHLFFRPDMSESVARRIEMVARLSAVLAADQLQLFYQPQVALGDSRLTGAEALLRWNDREWGWVSPGEFIPLAESTGLIVALGKWVLRQCCRQIREWEQTGLVVPGRVSVNVSAHQLEEPGFVEEFRGICQEAGVDPSRIEIELTESEAMRDPAGSATVLRRLSDAGFTLAIDDFGVAYSSLTYLKRFKAHKLKIDMSFVRGMVEDRDDRSIVAAIVSIARSLGMRTLAEGVELREQADLLESLSCDDAQGYLYGRPEPADVFAAAWLSR